MEQQTNIRKKFEVWVQAYIFFLAKKWKISYLDVEITQKNFQNPQGP